MIAELGLAALWIAAALAAAQGWIGWQGMTDADALRTARRVAVVQGAVVAGAMLLLILAFVRTDLSVALVVQHSHSLKPMLFKIAGTWGNHEGSMLLWVAVLGLAGAAIALFERGVAPPTHAATLAAQGVIALGFYAFLLIASNPFARAIPIAGEGQGLNPLLQDPGLAFHPPTLYLGYVGMSVAFSFAVGAMVTRDVGPAFARAMRPWVLGAWVFLTIGIAAGSYWAYYTLGWGGWWFWDPVENASLMPWLAATALLHSVSVLATRDGLRAWTVMLAVVAFSMSMVGTFLVRSGVLTSVHSFAVDPTRGSFILVLLTLYIGGALTLFGLRIGTVREGAPFALISREGLLVLNNLLLTVTLVLVLLGTLYPLVVEGVLGDKISIGPPWFNAVTGPVALILGVAMVFGPLVRWRRDAGVAVLRRGGAIVGVLLLASVAVALTVRAGSLLAAAGLAVAAAIVTGSVAPLAERNWRRTPLFVWGMVVAHLGVGVAIAGMASDALFTQERLVAVRLGDTTRVGPWTVRLIGVEPVATANFTAIDGIVAVSRAGKTTELRPQARSFWQPVMDTNVAALTTRWDGQLYVVLGKSDAQGRWQLRLWWKPFVPLIWGGGVLIALGGVLAMIGHWRRGRRSIGARVDRAFA